MRSFPILGLPIQFNTFRGGDRFIKVGRGVSLYQPAERNISESLNINTIVVGHLIEVRREREVKALQSWISQRLKWPELWALLINRQFLQGYKGIRQLTMADKLKSIIEPFLPLHAPLPPPTSKHTKFYFTLKLCCEVVGSIQRSYTNQFQHHCLETD